MSEDPLSLPPEIISLCEDSTAPISHICTENKDWTHTIQGCLQSPVSSLSELVSSNTDAKKIEHLLVYKAFTSRDRTATLTSLARLRDQHCELIHIGLEHQHETTKNIILPQDLVALGFTCIRQRKCKDHDFHLFRFSLYNYKHTPDWLNSRFWANPEHWDKTRW